MHPGFSFFDLLLARAQLNKVLVFPTEASLSRGKLHEASATAAFPDNFAILPQQFADDSQLFMKAMLTNSPSFNDH